MKAIILAAGLGSRLRPITNEVPKCMVPVNGICIVDKQIDNLQKNGINDIYIIAGYKADILTAYIRKRYPLVTVIKNEKYETTNNMYSLYLCLSQIGSIDDFILMNGDVYYDANIIGGMIENSSKNLIACDRNGYMEESMKVTTKDCSNTISHISKKITSDEFYAVSIDVYKIGKDAGRVLLAEIIKMIEVLKNENLWTEVALDKIFSLVEFYPYVITGRWFEIDNHNDLQQAEELFKGDLLCLR